MPFVYVTAWPLRMPDFVAPVLEGLAHCSPCVCSHGGMSRVGCGWGPGAGLHVVSGV